MQKRFLLLNCLLVSAIGNANTISTPEKAIVLSGREIGKRVCYYEGKAYSEGAVLQIGVHYIVCDKANNFETNGELKWHKLVNEGNKR